MKTRQQTTNELLNSVPIDEPPKCANKDVPSVMQNILTGLVKLGRYIYLCTKIYVLWIVLHFVASHLYIYVCVPQTLWGFLISPFMSVTPQCQSLRWIIHNGGNVLNNMWVILGTWIGSLLLGINNEPK
jgi:hypothetical protein